MKKLLYALVVASILFSTVFGSATTVRATEKELLLPHNTPPVITGVRGPSVLKIGEVGTWSVTAYDREGGSLAYSVMWGDKLRPTAEKIGTAESFQQTATFTHSYEVFGNYTIAFTVTDEQGLSAKTSISVTVKNGITPSIKIVSPNGGEVWYKSKIQTIRWIWPDLRPSCGDEKCLAPTGLYSPKISIDLYQRTSDGSKFVQHITTANLWNGYYSWKIAENIKDGKDYVIRISGMKNYISAISETDQTQHPMFFDESDSPFTIVSSPVITPAPTVSPAPTPIPVPDNPTLEQRIEKLEVFLANIQSQIEKILSFLFGLEI